MIPASAARWRYQSLWHAASDPTKQLFRVPAGAVSAKGRVGGAGDDRLAVHADLIIAGIVAVARSTGAAIAGPSQGHEIPMLARVRHDGPLRYFQVLTPGRLKLRSR